MNHLDHMNSIAGRAAHDYRVTGHGLRGPAPKLHRTLFNASTVSLLIQAACLTIILVVVVCAGIFMGAI